MKRNATSHGLHGSKALIGAAVGAISSTSIATSAPDPAVSAPATLWQLCLATLPIAQPNGWWAAWSFAPEITVPLVAFVLVYATGWVRSRGSKCAETPIRGGEALSAALGLLLLAVALISPLCRLSASLASAHMIQHLILVGVAPPLIILGASGRALRLAVGGCLPTASVKGSVNGNVRGVPLKVTCAAIGYGAAIWFWHAPASYQAALTDPSVHLAFVASLLGASLWFWHLVIRASSGAMGAAALALLATMIHTGMLGALLTFAPRPWYPLMETGALTWGLLPLEDQQLAGLIMWAPMGVIYLVATLALLGVRLIPATPRLSPRGRGA